MQYKRRCDNCKFSGDGDSIMAFNNELFCFYKISFFEALLGKHFAIVKREGVCDKHTYSKEYLILIEEYERLKSVNYRIEKDKARKSNLFSNKDH